MSGPVHVSSIAELERFRAALIEFEKRAQTALDVLTAELRRASEWLDEDRPNYWREQEKQAADSVHQAKLDVERCLIFTTIGDQEPACRQERMALQAAKDRFEYCHRKRQVVRHWQGVLEHEIDEFKGRISHLRRMLETQLPAARARLQLIIRRIEGYTVERPPESRDWHAEPSPETNPSPAMPKE